MANVHTPQSLETAMEHILREEFQRQIDALTERAVSELRASIQTATATVAARVAASYDISRQGMDIIVRVRNG